MRHLPLLRQVDLKKIIAYSSIAHMGYVSAGLFANNVIALQGICFFDVESWYSFEWLIPFGRYDL
jgi:NADH:ubiquinone oxidoreductase subunit 4 (subunit M)